jgi:hypothetical protein
MKKFIFLFFTIILANSLLAQSNKWSTISYTYSKGPVSPDYQYSYIILLNSNGTGKLSYTKASATNDYDFTFNKTERKSLNKALTNANVFVVGANDMKSEQTLVGGPSKTMIITMWQDPNLDQKPTTIEIPSQVKAEYLEGIQDLYDEVENLVPDDIWKKATQ